MDQKKKTIIKLIVIVLCVIAIVILIPQLWHLLWPFALGWLMAIIANPLVKFLENKIKLKRKHGSIIIIVLVLGLIIGILYGMIVGGIHLGKSVIREFPTAFAEFETLLQELANIINTKTNGQTALDATVISSYIIEKTKVMIDIFSQKSISYATSLLSNMPSILIGSLFAIMSSFFFIRDKEIMEKKVRKCLQRLNCREVLIIKDCCNDVFKNYFQAQLKISFVIFMLLLVGFWVLKVPYTPLVALGVAIIDFLPVFGSGTILWPWIVIDLVFGNYKKVFGLFIIYLLSLVTRQAIQPKILSSTMGLSTLASLILMYVGFQIAGVLGLLLSIPIGTLVHELYKKGFFKDIAEKIKLNFHIQEKSNSNI